MVEEMHHPDRAGENRSVRYERTDADYRWVLGILLASLILAAIMFSAVGWFFNAFERYQAKIKGSPYSLAPGPSTGLPEQPRLEQIDRLTNGEQGGAGRAPDASSLIPHPPAKVPDEVHLASYGPTDEKGFIYIPVERAMEFLVKTLPSRPASSSEDSKRQNGLVDGGGPNSGRMFRKEPRWDER
jgi:hypothetical protein